MDGDFSSMQEELQAILGYPLNTDEARELMLVAHDTVTNMVETHTSVSKLIGIIQRLILKYGMPISR